MKRWQDIDLLQAIHIELSHEGIEGPMNEMGERCPWPWDPQQLKGAPLGQYHCPYCGGMQIAGTEHLDWEGEGVDPIVAKLHQTTDARVWAEEFLKVVDSGVMPDEGFVTGWFANAIETAKMLEAQKLMQVGWFKPNEYSRAGNQSALSQWFFIPKDAGPPQDGWVPALLPIHWPPKE